MLSGLISDALNVGKTPREEMTVRNIEVTQLAEEGGGFEAKLLTHSLQESFEYSMIRGTVDFARCEVLVNGLERLDPSSYAHKRSGGEIGSLQHTQVNNGSKGAVLLHKSGWGLLIKLHEFCILYMYANFVS